MLGGWASNNRWALLGGIRGSAQMISYEIAMGLALIGDGAHLRHARPAGDRARARAHLFFGFLPAWGILYQPLGFLIFLIAGIAEIEAHPVRPSRERVRADQRLLHRVLGHEAG